MPSSFTKRPDVRAAVTVVAKTGGVLVLSALIVACQTATPSSPDPDARGPGLAAAAEAKAGSASDPERRHEAAILASVLPNPRRFLARSPSPYVMQRANWVQNQMRQLGPEYLNNL